jgi:hypothetical protein
MKGKPGTKLHEWQKKAALGGKCEKCDKDFPILSVEHIIPQHLLRQLGILDGVYEDEDNFALYCHTCNHFKGGQIDMSHPKTVPLLKKYVNKLS